MSEKKKLYTSMNFQLLAINKCKLLHVQMYFCFRLQDDLQEERERAADMEQRMQGDINDLQVKYCYIIDRE